MWRKYKSLLTLPIVHNPAINPSYLKYSVYVKDNFHFISVSIYLGPVLEILNASSSGGLVYSAGSYLTIECVYVNTSKVRRANVIPFLTELSSLILFQVELVTTTQHPLFPMDRKVPLKKDVLKWKFNNRTFSLQNRKRWI